MKTYKVKVRYVFEGAFYVKAESREEAQANVEKHCGLMMGGRIHTTLDEKNVYWVFGTHPETEIVSVNRLYKKTNSNKTYNDGKFNY
jgi:hypothetical protein